MKNKYDSKCNTHDHKQWSRKSFLQALGFLSGGSMMLGKTALTSSNHSFLSQSLANLEHDRVLVLCRFGGGNDGLSNIIPLNQYDDYVNARPTIHIPENKLLTVQEDVFAVPETMAPLEFLWKENGMKVVNGVGYNNINLSHAKSSHIWIDTDVENRVKGNGWIGRYFQEEFPDFIANPPSFPPALKVGGGTNNALCRGDEHQYAYTFGTVERLEQVAKNGVLYEVEGENTQNCTYQNKLNHIQKTSNFTTKYAQAIYEAYHRSSNYSGGYKTDSLSKQLAVISRLIKGNLGTRVYVITLSGFDTHKNQVTRHNNLMTSFSNAISTFYKDLDQAGWSDKVLTATFSEFGRRVSENGSKGTDHGRASNMMLFGKALNGTGAVNDYPSLTDLDNTGNLKYSTDFRAVYATLLREWLSVPEQTITRSIYGGSYSSLDLGFESKTSETLSVSGVENSSLGSYIKSSVSYDYDQNATLQITSPYSTHVEIRLFNLSGKEIGVICNEIISSGNTIAINMHTFKQDLKISEGYYIYKGITNYGNFSGKILL